jgi:hypothetical protein
MTFVYYNKSGEKIAETSAISLTEADAFYKIVFKSDPAKTASFSIIHAMCQHEWHYTEGGGYCEKCGYNEHLMTQQEKESP